MKTIRSYCSILVIIFFYQTLSFTQNTNIPSSIQKDFNNYIQQAEAAKKSNQANEAIMNYNKAAYLLWTNNLFKEAAQYYLIALGISEQSGNKNAIEMISSNLGLIYSDLEDYNKSAQYFSKSIDIKRKAGKKLELASELFNLAEAQRNLNKINESNKTLLESLDLSKELNNIDLMRNAYKNLASNYESIGNTQKSFEYFNLFRSLDNFLKEKQIKETNEKNQSEIQKMEGVTKQAIEDKKATENVLKTTEQSLKEEEAINRERQLQIDLLTKEKELNDMKLKNIKLIRNFIFGIAILLGVIAFLFYRSLLQKKKSNIALAFQNAEILRQKEEINKQHTNIQNSLTYANRIQRALLSSQENFAAFLPESFILFKPRDVVSGDFYWFSHSNLKSLFAKSFQIEQSGEEFETRDGKKFIIAAIDCTGHGVPGALMSMIGYNLMQEIISNGIVAPNQILSFLHKGIIKELKQNNKSEVQDGMDASIIFLDLDNKKLEFAGAKNPIIYIKKNKIYRLKGDNISVGGQIIKEEERNYTLQTVQIDEPVTVYMFSDGYIDQLGGKDGHKFLYLNFEKLLGEIHSKPFAEQKFILERTMDEWKGQRRQVDDVMILGFKITA